MCAHGSSKAWESTGDLFSAQGVRFPESEATVEKALLPRSGPDVAATLWVVSFFYSLYGSCAFIAYVFYHVLVYQFFQTITSYDWGSLFRVEVEASWGGRPFEA